MLESGSLLYKFSFWYLWDLGHGQYRKSNADSNLTSGCGYGQVLSIFIFLSDRFLFSFILEIFFCFGFLTSKSLLFSKLIFHRSFRISREYNCRSTDFIMEFFTLFLDAPDFEGDEDALELISRSNWLNLITIGPFFKMSSFLFS